MTDTDPTEATRRFVHALLELRDYLRQFMQKKFRAHNIDLTYEMHQIMASLWKKDGVNQQDLANLTLKDKASMTYLIDNLTKRELVFRKEDPRDRRNKLVYLTPKGKRLGHKVEPWVNELFEIVATGFKPADMEHYTRIVEEMRDNIRRE
ncbi:hypothetical protein A8C56_01735 [Niabella ginsenosidivorans]|uniref:HTH marR-type domain-containing protein n=1 Tax=Niabella ginsenosidivorans TaxID=1176587 RepID=A0A1A9HWV3_9BACT|nr:MarR family transcriptional regulator [Niabella ginsenosidivorans]ANH79866.1 hypothetical protein A8C56_01735 [Niabella ginsenosidivorans]